MILSGGVAEEFPHQRRIAALTFGAWLQFPGQPHLVARAESFAACSTIRALERSKLNAYEGTAPSNIDVIAKRYFSPTRIANLLLDHDEDELGFDVLYAGNFPDLSTATAIAEFLLRCPPEKKPSINKALFFLSRDGFSIGVPEPAKRYEKASLTTAKKAWSRYGSVSFFLLAQAELKFDFDNLPPNVPNILKHADNTLSHRNFQNFFPISKSFRDRVRAVLGKDNKVVRKFCVFPTGVTSLEKKLPAFSAAQLNIIDGYRAPSPY